MERTDLSEISKAVSGKLTGGTTVVSGVSIDTRTIKNGDVFFAIRGDRYDGHKFIEVAVSKGAAGVVVSKACKKNSGFPSIIIKDTLSALQGFAKYYRSKYDITVIGVTGSNGKTTTKDLLSSIISTRAKAISTEGNLNNHVGVPLTLFRLDRSHKYCIIEMGANHTGEIAKLTEIAKPSCGIITNIGLAHIGNFGTLKKILESKMELFNNLNKNGWAIINSYDANISPAAVKIKCRKKSFGIKNKADVMAIDINLGSRGTSFNMMYKGIRTNIKIPLPGLFNVYNALAAAAASFACASDITPGDIAYGIKNFMPQPKRMQVITLRDGTVLVNDAYNANPTSMLDSIENFSKIFYNKRKILVLGDMLELGRYGVQEHKKIGRLIAEKK